MRLGVDLDNTIVCYDTVFHEIARAEGLIGANVPTTKRGVRGHLRETGREEDWTLLQGLVYGPRMSVAKPFPGVVAFLAEARRMGWDAQIISHRTRRPYHGPPYDLHDSAWTWLEANGVVGETLTRRDVFFAETREAKMDRIRETRRETFIDDLPEFLTDDAFPTGVRRMLFDPANEASDDDRYHRALSWRDIRDLLLSRDNHE